MRTNLFAAIALMVPLLLGALSSQAGVIQSCDIPVLSGSALENNLDHMISPQSLETFRSVVTYTELKGEAHYKEKMNRIATYKSTLSSDTTRLEKALRAYQEAHFETRVAMSLSFAPYLTSPALGASWGDFGDNELTMAKSFPLPRNLKFQGLSALERLKAKKILEDKFSLETAALQNHIQKRVKEGPNQPYWLRLSQQLNSAPDIRQKIRIQEPYIQSFFTGVLEDFRDQQMTKVRHIFIRAPTLAYLVAKAQIGGEDLLAALDSIHGNGQLKIEGVQEAALPWTDDSEFSQLNDILSREVPRPVALRKLKSLDFLTAYMPILELYIQDTGQESCLLLETFLGLHAANLRIKNAAKMVAALSFMAIMPFLGPVPLALGSAGVGIWSLGELSKIEKDYVKTLTEIYSTDSNQTLDSILTGKLEELQTAKTMHLISIPVLLLPLGGPGLKAASKIFDH